MTEIKYDFSELVPLLYENRIDNLLELDGDNDYVTIGNVSQLNFDETESFTVEALVYTEEDADISLNNVVSKKADSGTTEGWVLRLNRPNQHGLLIADGTNKVIVGTNNTEALATGEWYHLAGVVDRETEEAKFYVDGILVDTKSISGLGSLSNDASALLGTWDNGSGGSWWEGKLDEIRIWDVARTEDEIIENLSASLVGNKQNLVGYWNFDSNNPGDSTVADETGNGNDGTLEGDATIVDSSFIGYVDIVLDEPVTAAPGLIVDYEIDGANTATKGTDFYGPELDISTTEAPGPTNSVFIPQGEDSARIYFTGLSDTVQEEDENITITLTSGTDDFGNEYVAANTREIISLNGDGDYVDIGNVSELDFDETESFTVEAWVYTDRDAGTDYNNAVTKKAGDGTTEGWVLRLNNSNQPELFLADGTNRVVLDNTDALATGEWYHLAGVIDRETGEAKLYVDGILVDTQSTSGLGSLSNDASALLGTWDASSNQDWWEGKLDDIRIWNDVRTQEEIQENLYGSLAGDENGLVGYWTFDTDSVSDDTISDLSSSSNDGTFIPDEDNQVVSLTTEETTKTVTGPAGVSLTQATTTETKTDSYLEIQNSDSSTDAIAFTSGSKTYTMAAWVKPESEGTIISKYHESITEGYFLRVNNNGNIISRRDREELTSDTTIPFDEWSHVATTFDDTANTLKIYINGEEVASQSQNSWNDLDGGNVPVVIGAYYDDYFSDVPELSDFLEGSIDEVQIWDVPLSEAEINNAMGGSLEADETGLLGYWDFDDSDSSGTSVADLTGNGYTGIVKAFEYTKVTTRVTSEGEDVVPESITETTEIIENISNSVIVDNFNIFVESSDPSVTFFVKDSGSFEAEVAFSDRFGDEITDDNDIVADSNGDASFTVKLTSEPTDDVTITLSAANDTLSTNNLTFDSTNWDTEKTIAITSLGETFETFDITAIVSSNDENYDSLSATLGVIDSTPTDTTKIKVTEGGTTQDDPEITVNINPVQDALEGQPTPGQFTVSLSDEAPAGGYVVPYEISGTAERETDYTVTETENNNVLGQSLSLDGDNDYVTIGNVSQLNFDETESFTVEAWVYSDEADNSFNNVVSKKVSNGTTEGWVLRLNNPNRPGLFIADGTNRVTVGANNIDALATGEWYHLAGVVDRETEEAKFYVDGILVDTQSTSGLGSLSSDVSALLGTWDNNGNGGSWWEGKLDEIRIWDVARTEEEIQNNLSQTLDGSESGLVGYWNFNNDSSTTATDLSSNSNDGSLQGDASFTGHSGFVTIDEGETSANIAIEAIDNDLAGGDKTVTVTLNEDSSAEATLEILDDEGSGVELAQLSTIGTIEVPSIELEVTTAYDSVSGDIGLKIASGANSYTLETDTAVNFSNGVEITIPAGTTFNDSSDSSQNTVVDVGSGGEAIAVGETSTTDLALLDVQILTYNQDETTGDVTANVQVRLTQEPASGETVTVELEDANGSDSTSFNFDSSNWDEYQETDADTFLELTANNGETAITADITSDVVNSDSNSIDLSLSTQIVATPLGDDNTSGDPLVVTTEGERIEFLATGAIVLDSGSTTDGTVELELFNRSADYTIADGETIAFDNGTQVEVTAETALTVGEAVEVPVIITSTASTDIPEDETGSIVKDPDETTVAVRLTSQPESGDAVLELTIDDSTEGEFSSNGGQTETLTFTTNNWEEYQEVTIKGVDDAITDGDITYNLEINGDGTNADANYQGFLDSLTITNEDNETTTESSDTTGTFESDYIASLSVDTTEVDESGTVTVTIDLNQGAPTGGLNVEYEIVDGTATVLQDVIVPFVLGSDNPLSVAERVSWAETDGTIFSFSGDIDFPPGIVPVLADIDGDGDLDAFAGESFPWPDSPYSEGITYYENIGTSEEPSYEERTGSDNPLDLSNFSLELYTAVPTFIDIDGDADLDAFVGDAGGDIYYFENTGTETSPNFEQKTGSDNPLDGINDGSVTIPSTSDNVLVPTFVDIDNDGDDDFFGGFGELGFELGEGLKTEAEIIYLENVDGTFVQRTGTDNPLDDAETDNGPNALTFGDIDEDGDFDVLIGDNDETLTYIRNIGSAEVPVFEEAPEYNPFADIDSDPYARLALGDLDGDSDLDAFIGNTNGAIAFYENQSINKVYIAEAQSSATVEVEVTDDRMAENKEEFTIQLVDSSDEEDDNFYETLTIEVTSDYQTTNGDAGTFYSIGLQIQDASILPANLTTEDDRFIIANAYDSTSGQIELEINDGSSSISLTAGESLEFENGTVIEVGTAVTLTAGTSEVIDISVTDTPSYNIDGGTELTFNDGSTVTVSSAVTISALESTSVFVEQQTNSSLRPSAGDTTEVSTSDSIRAYVNLEVGSDYNASTDSNLELKLDETVISTFALKEGTQLSFNGGETIVTVDSDTDIGTSATSVPVTIDTDDSSQTTIANGETTTTASSFQAEITIIDNDTAKVLIATDNSGNEVSGSYTTSEEGGEDTFYASLETEPTDEVTVYVGSSNSEEGLLEDTEELVELTFDNTNWETPQSFTVTGIDDEVDDGDIDYELITTVESDGDFFYRENAIDLEVVTGLTNGTVELQIDELNTERAQLQGGTSLNFSNGTVATVDTTVNLDNSEETQVSVTIDGSALGFGATNDSGEFKVTEAYDSTANELKLNNTTEGDISLTAGDTLTFTNGAVLSVEADVTISAGSADTVAATLTTAPSIVEAEDTTSFIKNISDDVQLSNTDNDDADVILVNFEEIAAEEGVANNFYQIELGSEPTDTVTVTMTPADDQIFLEDELAGEPISITFDSSNWNTPRTIAVTAVDDFEVEFDHTTDITFDVSESADSTYAGFNVSSKKVQVNIIDNDLPVASIESVAGAIEANAPGYFAISLDKTLPDEFDDTGLVVNYTVSGGTADTDGSDPTDDLQPITGSARIAPGENRTPLIAFPIDDFKAEGIPLDVTSAYSGGSVSLQINSGVDSDDLDDGDDFDVEAGTKLTFSNGAVATVDSTTTLKQSSPTTVPITFTSDSPETTIPVDESSRIPLETVVVTLDSGDDYTISSDADTATLKIDDNDAPGVRIIEVSEPTTVTEGQTTEYYISLLSEPSADVQIDISTTQTTRNLIVTSNLSNGEVWLQIDDTEVDSLTLLAGEVLTFKDGTNEVEAKVVADTFLTSDAGTSVGVVATDDSALSDGAITTSYTGEYSYEELSIISGDSLTFTSDNWYELQTVTIFGEDDNVVEIDPTDEDDDNVHQSTLTYSLTSGDTDYEGLKVPAQTIDIKDRPFDSNQTAQSLTEGFLALEDSLNDVTLPLIGSLEDVGLTSIGDMLTDLVADVRSQEAVTGETLAQAIIEAFNNNIDTGGSVTVEITDLTSEEIVFSIGAEDSIEKDISLAADLGLPALGIGMETEGDLDMSFDYNLGLKFGLSTTDGFFIDTADTSLEANAAVGLSDDFTATGSLGFLELEFLNGDNQGTGVDANFTLALNDSEVNDGDERLTFSELQDLRDSKELSSVVEYVFSGDAALDVDITTSIEGSTALPSFSFNLFSDLPLFNYTNADEEPAETTTLTLESAASVSEDSTTNISVINDNADDDIQLPKGTQLTFGSTTVVVNKTVALTNEGTDTIEVKLKDDGDDNNDETETIARDAEAEIEGSEFSLEFSDITLDFGSFVTGIVDPVVDILADIIEPIEPVVSAINTPIGFFEDIGLAGEFDTDGDGEATLIEVAGGILEAFESASNSKGVLQYAKFFEAVVGIVELYEAVEDLQDSLDSDNNFQIEFGDYTLQNFNGASSTTSASDVDPQTAGTSNLNSNTKNQAKNQGKSSSISNKIDNFFGALDKLGISIPILEDPFTAINLFLGNDIDLVTYDMPELDIQFEIDQSFPILATPRVNGLIQGDFSIFSDLVFGLDTVGFSSWEETGFDPAKSYLVLDGLYLSDVDPDTGEDVDELSIDATLGIGAELNAVVASASIIGGLSGEVGLDVVDVGEYTGQSDGKIRGSEVFSRIDDPTSMFELAGSLDAFFRAVVKIGVDLGFFKVKKTVYDKELASFPIFEFTLGGGSDSDSSGSGSGSSSGSASSGYIDGGLVFLDTNFNFAPDPLEPTTRTDSEGNYELEYEIGLFDANGNGVIDEDEGQIVVIGGTDVSTGEPLEIPMAGEVGTGVFITPISTVEKAFERFGPPGRPPGRGGELLEGALGLTPGGRKSDPYKAEGDGFGEGSRNIGGRAELHGLMVVGAGLLKGAGFNDDIPSVPVNEALVEILDSTEGKVNFRDRSVIEEIFDRASRKAGVDVIDPETEIDPEVTSKIAGLVSALNGAIFNVLEEQREEMKASGEGDGNNLAPPGGGEGPSGPPGGGEGPSGPPGGGEGPSGTPGGGEEPSGTPGGGEGQNPRSVNDINPMIKPFKGMLLGDLPRFAEEVRSGELSLEEMYDRIDEKLNEDGYQLRAVRKAEEIDGETVEETEFFIEEITQGASGTVANIEGATVFLDTNFNEKLNGSEPSAETDKSGKFFLDFENVTYDKNGNNKIDNDEAQIVVVGAIPLIASVETASVVSGLTTIKAGLERLEVGSEEAKNILKGILELDIDIDSFNSYGAKGEEFDSGIDGVGADILIKSLLANGDALLKNPDFSGNSFDVALEGIAQKLNDSGENFRLDNTNRIKQVFEEILTVAEITVAPEVVEAVAELVNSFNGLIIDLLEEKKGASNKAVKDVLGGIAPLEEVLLRELPKVTRQLTRGNITVDEAFESVESLLSDRGFDLTVRRNGTAEIDFTDLEVKGTGEDDTINGSGGEDSLIGGFGNDLMRGGNGEDNLEGRPGNDHLLGGSGDDVLSGGIGRDRLNGGPGNDTMTGGASIDRFIFAINGEFDAEVMGSDRITDFNPGQDIILLDKKTFTALQSNSGAGFSVEIEFASVANGAATNDAFIVYNSNNGKLFYNENGSEPGFGEGGQFAVLAGKPDISADDFQVR